LGRSLRGQLLGMLGGMLGVGPRQSSGCSGSGRGKYNKINEIA